MSILFSLVLNISLRSDINNLLPLLSFSHILGIHIHLFLYALRIRMAILPTKGSGRRCGGNPRGCSSSLRNGVAPHSLYFILNSGAFPWARCARPIYRGAQLRASSLRDNAGRTGKGWKKGNRPFRKGDKTHVRIFLSALESPVAGSFAQLLRNCREKC